MSTQVREEMVGCRQQLTLRRALERLLGGLWADDGAGAGDLAFA